MSGAAPNLLYTPAPNFNGTDSFTFLANDGLLDSALATIDITITGSNDAPTAISQNLNTDEDIALDIVLAGDDLDGDTLNFNVTVQPANGTLSGTAPNLQYLPNADFNGADQFSFVANDGTQDSAAATVDIAIAAINDRPVAGRPEYRN